MKKVLLLAVVVVVACVPEPIAPTSFSNGDVVVSKIAEIPEHGCDIYLIRANRLTSHTVTVCPKLSAEASTAMRRQQGKSTNTVQHQTVEAICPLCP